MITRLNHKNTTDVYDFLLDTLDKFEDFYITKNKERLFLKNNWKLIRSLLKQQEIYGIFNNRLKGLMIIFKEKGFRSYVKFLSINNKYNRDLIKYLLWNYAGQEIYCKLKKSNPLFEILKKKVFLPVGDRGQEGLLIKKAIKDVKLIVPKDEYLGDIYGENCREGKKFGRRFIKRSR
jgi:hypothetical protein